MQIVIAHARYHVTCTPYAKFGYIFEFPTPTLPIHYADDDDDDDDERICFNVA